MNTMRNMFSLVALTSSLMACNAHDDAAYNPMEDISPSDMVPNGLDENGLFDNGLFDNGLFDNGLMVNGVEVSVFGIETSGMDADGNVIAGIHVEGAELVAPGMRGEEFVGVTLSVRLTDGSSIPLRIDDVAPSAANPEHWHYQVSLPTFGGVSACGNDDAGNPRRALPLSGRWDSSAGTATGGDFVDDSNFFSLGCTHAAIAKCVRMGYEPWKSIEECDASGTCRTVPLRAYHQACTRMVRADYCGDGKSHTTNGVPINVWDDYGIQERAGVSSDFLRDAEWSPDGAVCVSNFRRDTDGNKRAYVEAHCPERLTAAFPCFGEQSTFFAENAALVPPEQRSLLRNEFQTLPQP
jgi:hypothetical protein